ncbi:GGDEF domain-containing protein [Xanthobacter pseudotagetidis]|uniref:GGDEF domain-containing protein n=1 Tax=Xanthobacter pseudotagetidis TaxID=3119911 RepID=UPI00372B73AD
MVHRRRLRRDCPARHRGVREQPRKPPGWFRFLAVSGCIFSAIREKMLDFSSLLLAIFLSTGGISAVLFAGWITSRRDGFLLTCALGALLVAVSVVCSAYYAKTPQVWLVTLAYTLLLTGLSTIYGTARQFRHDASPWRAVAIATGLALGITVPPHVLGLNGIGFFCGFAAAAGLLFLTSYEFWRARHEARGTLVALAASYFIIGLSFIPRAVMVALEGKAVMPGPPQNWAQTAGVALIIASVPALGALTLALNQKRLVRAHRQQALTDPLTGLPNRRALIERVAELSGTGALVLFDIDRFKAINDTRGHATGDAVIVMFARVLQRHAAPGEIAARLGGEEFVLAIPGGTADGLAVRAEAARREFAARVRAEHGLHCSASGGVAAGAMSEEGFSRLMGAADTALYQAKRQGRDRIVLAAAGTQEADDMPIA